MTDPGWYSEPYPLDHSITWREHYKRKSTCATCNHPVNNHEANECWTHTAGEQCWCAWLVTT